MTALEIVLVAAMVIAVAFAWRHRGSIAGSGAPDGVGMSASDIAHGSHHHSGHHGGDGGGWTGGHGGGGHHGG